MSNNDSGEGQRHNGDYDFYSDAIAIIENHWANIDQQEETKSETDFDDMDSFLESMEVRGSIDYWNEFVFLISMSFGESYIDFAPYFHAAKTILDDIDTFKELRNFLFEEFEIYDDYIESFTKDQLSERDNYVYEYAQDYVKTYFDNFTKTFKEEPPVERMAYIFTFVLNILMELEIFFYKVTKEMFEEENGDEDDGVAQ